MSVFVVSVLLSTRLRYVAIWDGRIYAACIAALGEQFTADGLRCAGHASQAYAAVAGLAQMLNPGSGIPLLVLNAVLFFAAGAAFFRLIRLVFPAGDELDRALLTAVFGMQPAFLAAVVQPGLDLPLLPAFLWAIVFAVERRWLWLIVMGVALAFTKETGVLLYALLLVCYALRVEMRMGDTVRARLIRVTRLAPTAVPGIVFVGYLLYRTTRPDQPIIWYGGSTSESVVSQFLVPRLDLYQVNYAVIILVLNFAWLMSAVLVADTFIGSVRALHREPRRPVAGSDGGLLAFITTLTLVTGYALTRFTTFGHTRYFLTITALFMVLFYASMLRLGIGPRTRRVVLASYVIVLGISTVRTIDPVSRKLFGTFAFGSHEMLNMTRVTGECCGYGLDQLVYNLQFTAFHDVVDDALAFIAPRDSALVVVPDSTGWILIGQLDPTSRRRTLAPSGVRPSVMEPSHLVQARSRPAAGHYLALPNADDARALELLDSVYAPALVKTVSRGGYDLSVYSLTARAVDSAR